MRSCPKERILAVERIITRRGRVSTNEILRSLDLLYDIQADRKSVYDDIAVLTRFLPIYTEGYGRYFVYVLRLEEDTPCEKRQPTRKR